LVCAMDVLREKTPENERLMSDIDNHTTERRLPEGRKLRLAIESFQAKLSNPIYKCRAHEVIYVTEKFLEFLKGGLPYNRMLILRDELIENSKAKSA